MIIGTAQMEFFLPESGSLKMKRESLRRLKDRVRHRFNVSVAEIGEQDKWQRALVAVAAVSSDKRNLESLLESVINDVKKDHSALQLTDYRIEIF